MQKIIPFKKDIIFKTNLSEITSISLEHELKSEGSDINGTFTISGKYKIADTSTNVEDYSYEIPFNIKIDDKYDTSKIVIDIDDFYYEVINNNILSVNIDVLIDKLEEKENDMDILEEKEQVRDDSLLSNEETILNTGEVVQEKERCIEDEDSEPENDDDDILFGREEKALNSIFDGIDNTGETYKSYHVYIVREGDSLETIMQKYSVSKEDLEAYNNLNELKINDKIVIPANYEES